MKELKPWQKHSSTHEVPWDQRAEQKFDSDLVRIKIGKRLSISLTGVIALSIFAIAICLLVL